MSFADAADPRHRSGIVIAARCQVDGGPGTRAQRSRRARRGPTGAGQNQPSSGRAAHFGRHERWGWLVKQHGKVGQALANADSEAA
jgi:hypothetical protein